MSLVKLLGAVNVIISIKRHLKGTFGFSGNLDPVFLFIEEIWHDVQKGSGSILSSIYSQIWAVCPANNDMMDLWLNIWYNKSKAIFFLDGKFFVFDISLIFLNNASFLCALCGYVTAFFSFAPKYTVQNPFWNKQVYPKFNNVMIENNLWHKSSSKSMLCNVAMKGYPWP